jgi:hypothetical protein
MGFFDNIEKFLEGGVDKIEGGIKYGIDSGKDVIENTEDTFSSIVSLPLILLAGGVAFFLYNSNLGQTQELQKSVGPAMMM